MELKQEHQVIFLNGTSSAEKTTIAKAFQTLWNEPILYASIDCFIFMFPKHVLGEDEVRRKDRQIGFVRWQYERVRRYGEYELVVDTAAISTSDCAIKLNALLISGVKANAFDRLRRDAVTPLSN